MDRLPIGNLFSLKSEISSDSRNIGNANNNQCISVALNEVTTANEHVRFIT